MPLRIGFTYNQRPASADGRIDERFAEWDDASTVNAVAAALAHAGEVIRLEATRELPMALQQAKPDIVFNMAEGLTGPNREAHVPAICEFLDIPYTGSDPTTLGVCLDKGRTKEVFRALRVPSPAFAVVNPGEPLPPLPSPPVIVKPVAEGSSRGITQRSYCATDADMRRLIDQVLENYRQPAIVEQWLPGREFTCAVLGNGHGARVLPIVELDFTALPPGSTPLYSYEAKWEWDTVDRPLAVHVCPARIPSALTSQIEQVVLAAWRALRLRDWARIDVRCDSAGAPHVLEANPIPGVIPGEVAASCYVGSARAAGLAYDAMILAVLEAGCARYGLSTGRA